MSIDTGGPAFPTESSAQTGSIVRLRKDAERYRWIRDPCSGAERVLFYSRGDYGRGLYSGSTLDEAIDAAMPAPAQPEQEGE